MDREYESVSYSRRMLLQTAGAGFGMLSLAGLTSSIRAATAAEATTAGEKAGAAAASARNFHFPPKAKRVIYLFMNGGPSHVDTFDPKPSLLKHAGELPDNTKADKKRGGFKPSPFRFHAHGQSGLVLSDLFPNMA